MPRTIDRPTNQSRAVRRVSPSIVDPAIAEPFTLEQELKPFGAWVGKPIWVPPKDSSKVLAETMLQESRPFASQNTRWALVEKKHRSDFTQVRELDLFQASIRLPKGRFFVTVTEQKNFDKITDPIPKCVQTRLDEFLSGPAMERGAKVYYLKPLCVEVGDELILTTRDDLTAAIAKVREEVFADYRRRALYRRPLAALVGAANLGLAIPRAVVKYAVGRKQKAIDAMQAHFEFERRKLALRTAKTYRSMRAAGCTFDDVLELTNSPKRTDVIEQYCVEQELSAAKRAQLLSMAAGTVPWFVALSLTVSFVSSVAGYLAGPPLIVCDPAFVAEMPGSGGVILKIGHFDEVGGVTHVEI
jgi:hypothetical protein